MATQPLRLLYTRAGIAALSLTVVPFVLWCAPYVAHAQSAPMAGMQREKASAPESTSVAVTVLGKATTFTLAQLQAMPQKTVKVHNGHTKADESYTGVRIGDILAAAGFTVEQSTHRTMLRSYVQAEGTDHYWVLYSLTEVEPTEHAGDVIVATAVDGHALGADGQFKLVSTEDAKPQRWVRNLSAVTVKSAE